MDGRFSFPAIAAILSAIFPTILLAQSAEIDAVKFAMSNCAGLRTVEVAADIEGNLLRRLSNVEAGGSADVVEINKISDVLKEFDSDEGKNEALRSVSDCIIRSLEALAIGKAEAGQTPTEVIVQASDVVPAPYVKVGNGQRFAMKIDETRVIGTEEIIFTFTKWYEELRLIDVRWTNMSSGQESWERIGVGQAADFTEDCRASLYAIKPHEEPSETQASFSVNCN